MLLADKKLLFQDIKFFLAEDNDVLKQLLKDAGGQREYYVTQLVNYIISDTGVIPEYEHAKELKIPIVKAMWVHMCINCESLLPHQPFSAVKNGLFVSLVMCPSQIPVDDRDVLLAMILFHHGEYKITLNSQCTHLVVGKPVGRKYELALKHPSKIKIVTPDWITDCVKQNKLLPEKEYEPLPFVGGRSPLKPCNAQENGPTTPTLATHTASSFLTPISPRQNSENNGKDTSSLLQNESFREVNEKSKVVENSSKSMYITPKLLEGCVFHFADYEERLPSETFLIWKDVIRKASGIIQDTYNNDVTHVLCLHQQSATFKKALADGKKIATAYWLNEVLVSRKMFKPKNPLHLPVPFTETLPGMKNSYITVSGYESKDRLLVKHMINFLGAHYTGHMTRSHTHLICKLPTGEKYKKAVEWEIPIVSPRWLGDMIQTGQIFPAKSKSRYAQLGEADEFLINPTFSTYITDLWETTKPEESNGTSTTSGKRKICEVQEEERSDVEPKEKQRKLNPTSTLKRVLFTGLTGATVHRLRQSVLKMKGELAKSVNDCTHLVAPKITRTVKFLSAVSICKFLVAPRWVDDSFEAKNFLDETNYTLVDPESEELFGFKLKRSLQRAQTRQVCKGLHFHVTPSILPAPNAMKEIIDCAGGKMTEVKTVEDVKNHFIKNTAEDKTHNSYLVSCMEDKRLWEDLVKDGYDVYNVELILSGVMKQELEWGHYSKEFSGTLESQNITPM